MMMMMMMMMMMKTLQLDVHRQPEVPARQMLHQARNQSLRTTQTQTQPAMRVSTTTTWLQTTSGFVLEVVLLRKIIIMTVEAKQTTLKTAS
jgi:hypothetical protein